MDASSKFDWTERPPTPEEWEEFQWEVEKSKHQDMQDWIRRQQ